MDSPSVVMLDSNLIPARFLRMGGNTRFMKNEPYNPNIMGAVQKVHFPPNDENVYILEAGAYIVELAEPRPWDWSEPVNYTIQQDKIMRLGGFLVLNINPFMALLTLNYRLVLEDGLPIAKLVYWKGNENGL